MSKNTPNRHHHSKKEQKRKLKPQALRQAKARLKAFKKKHSSGSAFFINTQIESNYRNMDSQELRSLMEAYVQVHGENLQEGGATKKAETEFHQDLDSLVHKTFGASPEEKKKEKVKKEEVDIFDIVLEFLCVEGYAETLEEAEWMMANILDEESVDIILGEAEGSYGQTPKAREAMSKLASARARKPASEYSQKGEKTRKVKAAEKQTKRQDMLSRGLSGGKKSSRPSSSRGKMSADDRTERRSERAFDLETTYGSGSVTKNPKKLRKQKAMGEIAKEGYENFEEWYMINILSEEMTPEQKKARAARLDYKDEVRAARRAWIKKANKGRPEYEGVKEAYQDPKFSRKDYLAKLQKRGGMGMGTKEDPHGYRDPKMAKVGAEFSKRVTAAHKARKSGEPDAYRAEKEGQSKKK